MIVAIWLFLGAILGTGIIFGKEYLSGIKQKWITVPVINQPAPII